MENIKLYEVSEEYIDYLVPHEPLLFHNKKPSQVNRRKYIGIVLTINGMSYFAPLSSFKEKHSRMRETLDFLKVSDYAVINMNCMFPVPKGCFSLVDIPKESNAKYRTLLIAEYRIIKSMQDKIRKNAAALYKLKVSGDVSSLTKRCNNFSLLEELCREYKR